MVYGCFCRKQRTAQENSQHWESVGIENGNYQAEGTPTQTTEKIAPKSCSVRLEITSELEHQEATSCGQTSEIHEVGFKKINITSGQNIVQPEIPELVHHETPQKNKQEIGCDIDKKEDNKLSSSEVSPDKPDDQHVQEVICKHTQATGNNTFQKQKRTRSCSI